MLLIVTDQREFDFPQTDSGSTIPAAVKGGGSRHVKR
jgi:hypothetical protein